MPYLAEIVGLINTSLADNKLKDGSRFVKNLNGISELVIRNGEEQTTIPVLVNTNDWKQYDGLDGRYSIQIYHRVLDVEQVESPLSFGDGATNGRESAKMSLFCRSQENKTRPLSTCFYATITIKSTVLGGYPDTLCWVTWCNPRGSTR